MHSYIQYINLMSICVCECSFFAHVILCLIHCGNDGGNPAGQQLVGNSDPFRVETSFPEAPWKLHQERDEDVEGRTAHRKSLQSALRLV